ncbi:hypothetical protein [Olene mendosa nucleopolyhedrovirus]|uniref:Uncharacterized protein n=1 Tax=Olene mendosa nucleopolyhedrovirus TaxID=2933796 RepID=A0AAX3AUN5_9ABAC|nr:hypothetical protein QKV28_gp143 [Olene mendosa nucleopolyhedrovirus]UOQ18926.1 hypothetical protein [Olene mendosa nucleopolyhedrovirus]
MFLYMMKVRRVQRERPQRSNGGVRQRLLNIVGRGGDRAFYNLCGNTLRHLLPKLGSLDAIKSTVDAIVETEQCLFNKSYLLKYSVAYLAAHSDGTNLQCALNLQLLSYLLTRYDRYLN